MRAPTLLALAVAAAVPLAGCGSGSGGGGTTRAVAPKAATKPVTGYQFRTVVPTTWGDVRDQFSADDGSSPPDIAFGDVNAKGFKANLLVERERTTTLRGKTIAEVDKTIRARTKDPSGTTASASVPLKLDGTDALESTTTGTQNAQKLERRQVIALHEGNLYIVGLTSAAGDAKADAVLRGVVAGWRWTP